MTDSDCIDSSSVHYRSLNENIKNDSEQVQPKKCFWLMQKFADIATNKIIEDVLLSSEF